MDIHLLVNVSARAWALPVLARLHEGVPARQAPLMAATGAGRTAFAQSMAHLTELGLIERNPGHGHPLRPEFRLTAAGVQAAALAHRVQAVPAPQEALLLKRSWTLPVLSVLQEPRPFGDIKRALPRVTDRALSQALKGLEAQHWVSRAILDARPPRPIYSAVGAGAEIAEAAGAFLHAA